MVLKALAQIQCSSLKGGIWEQGESLNFNAVSLMSIPLSLCQTLESSFNFVLLLKYISVIHIHHKSVLIEGSKNNTTNFFFPSKLRGKIAHICISFKICIDNLTYQIFKLKGGNCPAWAPTRSAQPLPQVINMSISITFFTFL